MEGRQPHPAELNPSYWLRRLGNFIFGSVHDDPSFEDGEKSKSDNEQDLCPICTEELSTHPCLSLPCILSLYSAFTDITIQVIQSTYFIQLAFRYSIVDYHALIFIYILYIYFLVLGLGSQKPCLPLRPRINPSRSSYSKFQHIL